MIDVDDVRRPDGISTVSSGVDIVAELQAVTVDGGGKFVEKAVEIIAFQLTTAIGAKPHAERAPSQRHSRSSCEHPLDGEQLSHQRNDRCRCTIANDRAKSRPGAGRIQILPRLVTWQGNGDQKVESPTLV